MIVFEMRLGLDLLLGLVIVKGWLIRLAWLITAIGYVNERGVQKHRKDTVGYPSSSSPPKSDIVECGVFWELLELPVPIANSYEARHVR